MPKIFSPLRYPGGKSSLADPLSEVLKLNKLQHGHYAEPYAGGAGLGLAMLFRANVEQIHINDLDPSIWSFWHAVLHLSVNFIELIERTPVSIDEWHKQREIQLRQNLSEPFELAFATFFLNRTNRSGIIKNAGPIGGLSQNGKYKIDCRFNKKALIKKIRLIAEYKRRIHLYRLDAIEFLDHIENNLPTNTFSYIDPPYFHKGASLYTSFYTFKDHSVVAERILSLSKTWLTTYDDALEVKKLYKQRRQFSISLNYSLQRKRRGSEVLIASKGLRVPAAFKGGRNREKRGSFAE